MANKIEGSSQIRGGQNLHAQASLETTSGSQRFLRLCTPAQGAKPRRECNLLIEAF